MSQQNFSWLESEYSNMCEHLRIWSNINSGTYHLAGLERMADVIQTEFADLSHDIQRINFPDAFEMGDDGQLHEVALGPLIQIRQRPNAPHQVLLTGHMDTVYPPDHPFQSVKPIDDHTWNGPGVTDMKGGLLVMLYALQAFERSEHAKQLGWTVCVNADEEIGSLGSASHLESLVPQFKCGFVFEPSMTPDGAIAGKRKGSGRFSFVVHGQAAHSGRSFAKGRSAIIAAAECMRLIHQLNGQRDGVTLNVGRVRGGGPLNVIPDLCVFHVDVRHQQPVDEAWVFSALQDCKNTIAQMDGIKLEMHGDFGRGPKIINPPLQALLDMVVATAGDLGQTINVQASGGCCDGNNLAAKGLPVVDSMGVRGGFIHSTDEYIILPSLVERAQLMTVLLEKIAQGKVTL